MCPGRGGSVPVGDGLAVDAQTPGSHVLLDPALRQPGRGDSAAHGRQGGLVVGHLGAGRASGAPAVDSHEPLLEHGAIGGYRLGQHHRGPGRVLQMVNGARYRVEVVAVTAVPPLTVTCVADEDDARPRRHATPQRVTAPSHPGGTVVGSRRG